MTLQQGLVFAGLALAVFALAVAGSWVAMQHGPILPTLALLVLVLAVWAVCGW